MSVNEALYEHSYKNLMLMCAVLPTYDNDKKTDSEGEKRSIRADDPDNDALVDRLLD